MRATARPWLPSVAALSVRGRRPAAASSSSGKVAKPPAPVPSRAARARLTAQEAPRILNDGRPRRADSSLTRTPATPGCRAGRSGAKTLGAARRQEDLLVLRSGAVVAVGGHGVSWRVAAG